MAGEFDEGKDHRDYTKWVWGGIVIALLIMLVAVRLSNHTVSTRSQANVKHILIKVDEKDPAQRQRALATITDLRKRILAGESFEKLAKDYSDDPQSGARGGYLGWEDKGVYDKAFEEYVWNGPLNQVSDVVTTAFGYHLIVVMERKYSDADKFDMDVENKAKKEAPKVELKTPTGIPQAEPAMPAPAVTIPPTQAVPSAQAVPPAEPVPAPAAAPAPAPSPTPAPAAQ